MEDRLQARVQTSWGMTELSPLGTVAPGARARTRPSLRAARRSGLDLKLTDAAGKTLPQQRNVTGHLKVKGASVVDRYFKADNGRRWTTRAISIPAISPASTTTAISPSPAAPRT